MFHIRIALPCVFHKYLHLVCYTTLAFIMPHYTHARLLCHISFPSFDENKPACYKYTQFIASFPIGSAQSIRSQLVSFTLPICSCQPVRTQQLRSAAPDMESKLEYPLRARDPPPYCQSAGNGNTLSCANPARMGCTNRHSWLISNLPAHSYSCPVASGPGVWGKLGHIPSWRNANLGSVTI